MHPVTPKARRIGQTKCNSTAKAENERNPLSTLAKQLSRHNVYANGTSKRRSVHNGEDPFATEARSASSMHVCMYILAFVRRSSLHTVPGCSFPPRCARVLPFEKSAERAQSCNAGSEYRYSLERLRNRLRDRIVSALAQSSVPRLLHTTGARISYRAAINAQRSRSTAASCAPLG